MNREKILDGLRGMAILQVVLVHILYWLNIFDSGIPATLKSFLLFEMPVFFFVTGAVNSLGKRQSYKNFCVKRVKGLLIPYYVYSAICITIAGGYLMIHSELSVKSAISLVLSWLVPLDHQIMPLSYFSWAVWFVPVYIVSIILFPFIRAAALKLGGIFVIVQIAAFGIVEILCAKISANTNIEDIYTLLNILQKSAFYMIFMGLGVLYPKLKERDRKKVIAAAALLFVSLAGMSACKYLFGDTIDMQSNKFPPNHMFLLYSFAVLSLVYIALPLIKNLYLRLIKTMPLLDRLVLLFSKNSIYVFLYQTFSFWIVGVVFKRTGLTNDTLKLIFAVIAVYPLIWLTIRIADRLKTEKRKDKTENPNRA
ncbi:MAG: acyltransferase [Clostridiales bacterium]|nr:acyltransferase [Clostridiales bacterium]